MSNCAYIYTPRLSDASVRLFVSTLMEAGVNITHLGKHDPPKKWAGDAESAVSQIVSGTDLTNWTFLRDTKNRLEFSIEIHRDPRWDHDTISISGVSADCLRHIVESLVARIDYFIATIGVIGKGMDQQWQVVGLSPDCPENLRQRFITT